MGGSSARTAPAPLRSRTRALAPAAALALAACGSAAGGGDEVTFALQAPVQQAYGASTRRGAELAVQEINAAGGIRGRTLALLVKDDEADPTKAIEIAAELVRDARVVALAGPVNSGTTLASGTIYNGESDEVRGTLPVLATTATSPAVSRLGDWVFRVASSDSANAVALAEVARRISPAVGVMYSNDDYGRGLAAAFSSALAKGGGSVPEADPYLEEMTDFTPYLRRMQGRGVRMVFVAGLDGSAGRIIAQARQLGMDARFIGGDGLEPLKARGATYDGTLVGLLFHRDAGDEARGFAERYRRAYDEEADPFAAAAYDAVKLLAAAAAANGATREGVQRYLHRLGQDGGAPAFQGATGTLRFDPNGDPLQKQFAVGTIQNGTIHLTRANR